MTPRVLVREEISEAGVDLLRERFEVDVDAESALEEIIGGYDAIVVRSATKLTADLIARAERLKVIGRAGVGVDNVDVDAATRRGIIVANAPESTVVSAAEHTIGLLVALARNIPQAHAALKQGRWERSAYGGIELAGKTLGVLGFGRIGQQVARRALGLGMRVVAFDPYVTAERFRELGAEGVESPEDVYAVADFLTLHLPLTPETRGSVDAAAFDAMRPGVRIVNAARGPLARRGRPARGAPLRQGRRRGARRLRRRAVLRPAARARQRRRHAAPRGVDGRGAGSRGRDRGRAGRRRARGRPRLERRQHPGGRRRRPRDARAVRAARLAARAHRDGARGRLGRGDRDHGARRPRRLRRAPPHGRGAQRRFPGPRRPAGQLRQRAAHRRRARDRGARGALAHGPRLHEPRARRAAQRRLHRRGRRHDDRQRPPVVARQRPRLRHRARARAALRVLPLRRRARRDRPRRDAVRRGRRQHRRA